MKKDFLSINELSSEELQRIFSVAKKLKEESYRAITDPDYIPSYAKTFKNLSAVQIFMLPSTRTSSSFSVAWENMGGTVHYVDATKTHFKKGVEPLHHVAQVYSRYYQCLFIRTVGVDGHQVLEEFAENSIVPVINAMDENYHPMQGLTDLFTLEEKLSSVKGKQITHLGYGNNNVTHSLMYAAVKLGANVAVVCPPDSKVGGKHFSYGPMQSIVDECNRIAEKTGSKSIYVTHNINDKIIEMTDVITTDAHSIMGYSEEDNALLREQLKPYRLDESITNRIRNPNWLFIHCMPVHEGADGKGEEVAMTIADSEHSIIHDEAENRLHMQRALLYHMATSDPNNNPFRPDMQKYQKPIQG